MLHVRPNMFLSYIRNSLALQSAAIGSSYNSALLARLFAEIDVELSRFVYGMLLIYTIF